MVGLKSALLLFLNTTDHRCNFIHCTTCMFTYYINSEWLEVEVNTCAV